MNVDVKFSEADTQIPVKFANLQVAGGGTGDHTALANRDAPDQHPMSAITGLEDALAGASGSCQKQWDLLGTYTITEEAPVWSITLKDLPGYTEFMVYFRGVRASITSADISFYVNGKWVLGSALGNDCVARIHLVLLDCWSMMYTEPRSANSFAPQIGMNFRPNPAETNPAVELKIKNRYDGATIQKGTVEIYGAR